MNHTISVKRHWLNLILNIFYIPFLTTNRSIYSIYNFCKLRWYKIDPITCPLVPFRPGFPVSPFIPWSPCSPFCPGSPVMFAVSFWVIKTCKLVKGSVVMQSKPLTVSSVKNQPYNVIDDIDNNDDDYHKCCLSWWPCFSFFSFTTCLQLRKLYHNE